MSANEAKVLSGIEKSGKKLVSIDEIHAIMNGSRGYARFMAFELCRKGWLKRVRKGLYRMASSKVVEPLSLLAELDLPYFLAYRSAAARHGLVEHNARIVHALTKRPDRKMKLRGVEIVLHRVPEHLFFGFERIEGLPVASLDRTILDLLAKPRLAGGIIEAAACLGRALPRLAASRILEYLRRYGRSSLAQRLGYFAERFGGGDLVEVALSTMRPGCKILLGSRALYGTGGTLNRRFNIIENVPLSDLPRSGGAEREQRRELDVVLL